MSLLNSCKVTSITSTLYSSFNTTPVTLLCMNPYIQNNPLLFDIKLVIRSPRSIKDRQYKDQKKLDKRTNNNLQNTTQKTTDWSNRTLQKPGEGWTQVTDANKCTYLYEGYIDINKNESKNNVQGRQSWIYRTYDFS
jgi:hypothetical protein